MIRMYKVGMIVIFASMAFIATGQMVLPKQIIAKIKKDKVYIKWEPNSLEEWNTSQNTGYIVESYVLNNGKERLIKSEKVKPAINKEWDDKLNTIVGYKSSFYEGAQKLLLSDKKELENDQFFKAMKMKSAEAMDSFRLGFLVYTSLYDMEISEMSGLGYRTDVLPNTNYRFKVYVIGRSPMIVDVRANQSYDQIAPQLNAEWDDHLVHFNWETKSMKHLYYGYFLEKSEDGIHYMLSDSLPHVNTLDKRANKRYHDYTMKDTLSENYKNYYYRLRGMDYFGDYSKKVSKISGYGYDKMLLSPYFVNAEQLENNHALLEWKISKKETRLIRDFSIYRSDSTDGVYELAVDSIPVTDRNISIPMTFSTNYYRIESNPKDGGSLSSMPIHVMGMDTIPPAVPTIVSARIDSLGAVELVWNKNTEIDLWGYKIFRANFEEEEYALLNAIPILDTMFIDSIDISLSTNDNIYYTLLACDKRNNRSDFTDAIIIEKPDVEPPTSTMIKSLIQRTDSLDITFYPSMSNDVVEYRIFRRDINTDSTWTLIANLDTMVVRFDSISNVYTHTDLNLVYERTYAYTLVVVDDVDLESNPSDLEMIFLKKPLVVFEPFVKIEHSFDPETKEVVLTWECNDAKNLNNMLIYRGWDDKRMGRYKYVEGKENSFTDVIDGKEKVFYYLKPSFDGHLGNFYSEMITIDLVDHSKR